MFALAEAEAADSTDGTGFFAFVDTAEALCAVFHNIEIVLFGDFHDGIHISNHTVEVYYYDSFGAVGDGFFDFGG